MSLKLIVREKEIQQAKCQSRMTSKLMLCFSPGISCHKTLHFVWCNLFWMSHLFIKFLLWKVTKLNKDKVPVSVFPYKLIRRSLIALYIMILARQRNNEMSPCIFSSTRYGCAHSSCQMNQEWFTRGQRLVMMLSCMWISELMAHHSYLTIIPEIPQEKWNNLSPNAKGLYSLYIYIYTYA